MRVEVVSSMDGGARGCVVRVTPSEGFFLAVSGPSISHTRHSLQIYSAHVSSACPGAPLALSCPPLRRCSHLQNRRHAPRSRSAALHESSHEGIRLGSRCGQQPQSGLRFEELGGVGPLLGRCTPRVNANDLPKRDFRLLRIDSSAQALGAAGVQVLPCVYPHRHSVFTPISTLHSCRGGRWARGGGGGPLWWVKGEPGRGVWGVVERGLWEEVERGGEEWRSPFGGALSGALFTRTS